MRARLIPAVALALLACVPTALAGVPGFDRERLDVFDFHLFDLGVADHDGDGDLDVYTLNHLARQSLLSNDGAGAFSERLYRAGLAQTRAFPGWEDRRGPRIDGPGLYLSPDSGLLLRHAGGGAARGTARFLFRPKVGSRGRARVDVRRRRRSGPDRFVASFRLAGDSRIGLDPPSQAHPWRVTVRRPFPLGRTYVGSRELNPDSRSFTLYLRDRHGIAWADVAGGADTDAFIVRGGLRGRIGAVQGVIQDELLAGDAGRFRPAGAGGSIRKGSCRGRSAGAADVDGDGRLDLYSTCKGDPPRVWRQRAGGGFEPASRGLRRAGLETDVIRFADLDGDPALEVVAITDRRVQVYDRSGGWGRTQSMDARHEARKGAQLSAGDPDADGDQDLYLAHPSGSTLLRNRGGRLDAVDPGLAGLPRAALAAAWVDYDNDGLLDLHAFPAGLFRQAPGFEFGRVGAFTAVDRPFEARLAWPDVDSDGFREPVISARERRPARLFRSFVFANDGGPNHWLELDLTGRAPNRQAIGARVRVRAGGHAQTAWVGQSETSVYSQGHYRLYFGLGPETSARVEVRWPDGRTRDLGRVAADQVLAVGE